MMNLLKTQYRDNAKVVDGKLILSLPNAQTPVVWQMDLSEIKASSLEVNDNKKDGFALVMKTPDGEIVQIAPFDQKDQAVRSLMAASRALNNAQGKISSQNRSAQATEGQTVILGSEKKSGLFKKIGLIVLGLLIIFLMLSYLSAIGPQSPARLERTSNNAAISAPDTNGVPVSADDFLKRR